MSFHFQIPDIINGIFEGGIGLLSMLNIKALLRDKTIKGSHWGVTAYATAWGAYNLYYYPHLGQWVSFAGGLVIFATNTTWLGLLYYYWKHPHAALPQAVTHLVHPFDMRTPV